tara:strand:+ start:128 stop:649 length:522 start_codon:yes stop_codon:yes gene_type:complete
MDNKNSHISNFAGILAQNVTRGSELYDGIPMACMSPQRRGIVIEQIARSSEAVPTADPEKTSRSRSPYDWLREEGARVECKSAQLTWNRGWLVHFKNIKRDKYDVLILCLYLPRGILIFECFGDVPLYGQGTVQKAKGECLQLRAGKVESEDAIASIIAKLLVFSKQTMSISF